ncbi:MAG TPA: hypothetical protein VKR61_12420 [Bryobacteraceae bacterium]|nr:hypothetical protein [Bryobacteraceae bacterium]
MNELTVVDKASEWRRMKSLALNSVSSPITKRVYNMVLDEFFAWYAEEPRPGFTKATVSAWRVTLEVNLRWRRDRKNDRLPRTLEPMLAARRVL